jgi:hypothetical protein
MSDKVIPKTGRWGLRKYAQILATVYWKKRTALEVAGALDSVGKQGHQSVREVLWGMRDLGLVHVCEWCPPEVPRSSLLVARFAFGPGQDAPYPVACNRVPGVRRNGTWVRAELTHFATIIRVLREGATRTEIHERCGTLHQNLAPLIREMRALAIIRTSAWQLRDDGAGLPTEVLSLGHGREAPRPQPKTRAEIGRKHRLRKRARLATLQVVHAIAGNHTLPSEGVQPWALLGRDIR